MSLQKRIDAFFAENLPDYEPIAIDITGKDRLRICVFIERLDLVPITIKDCVFVTKRLKKSLEDTPFEYDLEVSSPGPNRPLTKPAHFERFLNHKISLITREPVYETQLKYKGIITSCDQMQISIIPEGIDKQHVIEYTNIKSAKLIT